MTCLCSCERGGDALTGRGGYPGKPFLFVTLLDTCIFGVLCRRAAALLLSSVLQIFDRDCFLRAIRLTAFLLSGIYCDRNLLLLTLGVVTYLIYNKWSHLGDEI